MLLIALFMATGFLETSRAATAPLSLVGRQFSLADTNGTITMRFLDNHRYKRTGDTNEGYFTATRTADTWRVATTTSDGAETIQYTFVYTSAEFGTVTTVKAGSRVSGIFSEASIPEVGLAAMTIQNVISPTGPSTYTIRFSGGTTGSFVIDLPGYGSGTFIYTPATNSAKLVLTFSGDLVGDVDNLDLEFRASSGSPIPSRHSGTQLISGQVYPIEGTFTYTSVSQ
jgi:hypothetical protein